MPAMKAFAAHLLRMVALVLASGIACAILVRSAPGALVDERELDRRLGEDSLAALRAQKAKEAKLGTVFVRYLHGLILGDLGYSESNHEPIAALIAERAPETLRELAIGLAGAWLLGLGLAIPSGRWRQSRYIFLAYDATSTIAAGFLLSLPAALVAYLCLVAGAPASVVLMLVLAPKVFQFARNLIVQGYGASHVAMARARGVGEARILWAHVLRAAAPQLLAVAAVSASMAIGAAIPIEAICDVPGLGRLAWQAALARDLPLLVNLTMLVGLVTVAAMAVAETVSKHGVAPAVGATA
ncbi:MAG TPA: ABC transporter permease [Bryobacteraceae bacterium]|nr:ABC transporter permease [Bryobacteraceae bacterium]